MLSSVLPSLDCSECPRKHLKLRCFYTAVYFWGCCSRRCEVTQYRNKTFRHVLIAELCVSEQSIQPSSIQNQFIRSSDTKGTKAHFSRFSAHKRSYQEVWREEMLCISTSPDTKNVHDDARARPAKT